MFCFSIYHQNRFNQNQRLIQLQSWTYSSQHIRDHFRKIDMKMQEIEKVRFFEGFCM